MVYCTKCGEQNPDDAEFCVKCGADLYPSRIERREWRRREREMCFGVPVSGQLLGIIFGFIIVVWGLSSLMGRPVNFFALIAIVFGVIILMGALRGSSRR